MSCYTHVVRTSLKASSHDNCFRNVRLNTLLVSLIDSTNHEALTVTFTCDRKFPPYYTELAKKVCPRLRDSTCWRSGEITQPRTNFFGQLCRMPNRFKAYRVHTSALKTANIFSHRRTTSSKKISAQQLEALALFVGTTSRVTNHRPSKMIGFGCCCCRGEMSQGGRMYRTIVQD